MASREEGMAVLARSTATVRFHQGRLDSYPKQKN